MACMNLVFLQLQLLELGPECETLLGKEMHHKRLLLQNRVQCEVARVTHYKFCPQGRDAVLYSRGEDATTPPRGALVPRSACRSSGQ